MIVLRGCVQAAIAPSINAAAARVLDRLGITLVEVAEAGCCGAIPQHLDAYAEALDLVRRNIDAWWPALESGAEAIVITASGCGTMVAEYGHLLRNDAAYAAKAERISKGAKDISEIVAAEGSALANAFAGRKQRGETLAFHSPCSLQHGLKVKGVVESILRDAGFALTPVPDGHLCCGSAGTYSILQPELSRQLLANKVKSLESGSPEVIATANIGCLTHIQSGTQRPVRHWIEVLDARLGT
jgi:glycolate oxidase iron-sulfur subunit